MKQLVFEQEFDCPLELLLKVRKERYQQPERYPELKNIQLISEKKEGSRIHQTRRISMTDSLPEIVASLVPVSFSSFIDESIFDTDTQTHTFEAYLADGLDNLVNVKGKSQYQSIDADHSRRQYDIEIRSNAFLIGSVIEAAIAESYLKNLEKDRSSILASIASFKGAENEDPPADTKTSKL